MRDILAEVMLNTFRSYDPATGLTKSNSIACEACYARKVRCDPVDGEVKCRQCKAHGVPCQPRTRKRKAPWTDRNDVDRTGASLSHNAVVLKRVSQPQPADQERDSEPQDLAAAHDSDNVALPIPNFAQTQNYGSSSTGSVSCTNEHALTPASSHRSQPNQSARNESRTRHTAVPSGDILSSDTVVVTSITNSSVESSLNVQVLKLFSASDLPEASLRKSLISAFTSHCYAWQPVVEYKSLLASPTTVNGSLLLLQVILLVGSLVRPDECEVGFSTRQYLRVKALLHFSHDEDPLNLLAALCLMQYYTHDEPPNALEDSGNATAVELALKIGLHNIPREEFTLRKRIWWAVVARDSMISCIHNRPRLIQLEDCTTARLDSRDFVNPKEEESHLFICHVEVSRILGDLHTFAERDGEVSMSKKHNISKRLQQCIEMLPDTLRIESFQKDLLIWKSEAAELHVHILTCIVLLSKTQVTQQLTSASAPSLTAALLSVRIIQMLYAQQGWFLGSKIAWHLQVAAVPIVASTQVASLRKSADEALNSIEDILETLGEGEPMAKTNLMRLRAIRKALNTTHAETPDGRNATIGTELWEEVDQIARNILHTYGPDAMKEHDRIAECIDNSRSAQAERRTHAAAETLTALYSRPSADFDQACLTPAGGMSPVIERPNNDFEPVIQREDVMTLMAEFSKCSHNWMSRRLGDGFGALV